MININLLPNSRLDKIKAAKRQRSISAFTVIAIVIGMAIPVILLIIWLGQKGVIVLTQRSIDRQTEELGKVENLDRILTVQNQLNALPVLNQQRLYQSTFLALLPKLLPANVSLTEIGIVENGTVRVVGAAPSASPIEDFIAIVKRTELFKENEFRLAFASVVPNNITPSSEGESTFEVVFTIDPVLLQRSFDEGIRIASKVLKEPTPTAAPATITPTPAPVVQ